MKRIAERRAVRCKLVAFDAAQNRGTFQCPEGHQWSAALMKRDPRGKLPSEAMITKLARYWQNSGVSVPCPRCSKAA